MNISRHGRIALLIALCCAGSAVAADRDDRDRPDRRPLENWRRAALQTMRVAVGNFVSRPADFALYRSAGFNSLVVFDADTYDASRHAWNFKSEEEVRRETEFARVNGMPLIVSLEVEPYEPASIPQIGDDDLRKRIELWKAYGDEIIVGVSPWYDDTFWERVEVSRQRHVRQLVKDVARDWYVFGMIGEFGFNATDDQIAEYFDASAFDHLIMLMYPYNVGGQVTGYPLDNMASFDADADMTRYVDRFIARMNEKFFTRLHGGQLILLVVQAFYYANEPLGHVPRASDIRIMTERGNEQLRAVAGQQFNNAIAYCCWGGDEPGFIGLADRADWITAAHDVHEILDRRTPLGFRR